MKSKFVNWLGTVAIATFMVLFVTVSDVNATEGTDFSGQDQSPAQIEQTEELSSVEPEGDVSSEEETTIPEEEPVIPEEEITVPEENTGADSPVLEDEPALPEGWVKNESGGWSYYGKGGATYTGWVSSGGAWYYIQDSIMVSGQADVEIGGKYYAFNADGTMKTGWHSEAYEDEESGETGTNWYYYNGVTGGNKHFGWLQLGKIWYYMDEIGQMVSDGIVLIGGVYDEETGIPMSGTEYAFDKNGAMITGWYKDTNTETYVDDETNEEVTETWTDWYYFNGSGAMHHGWLSLGGVWYYMDEDYGHMYADSIFLIGGEYGEDGIPMSGAEYAFNASGAMVTGWYSMAGTTENEEGEEVPATFWFYFDGSGAMHKGWLNLRGTWYYLDEESGVMYSNGSYTVGGQWVGDEETGELIGGTNYVFRADGSMLTGWYKEEYEDTYTDPETGEEVADAWTEWYYLNANGLPHKGWLNLGGTWYYFDPEYGGMYSDGRYNIGGQYMWVEDESFDEGGYNMLIDGTGAWYAFRANGAMITGWYEEVWDEEYSDWYYYNADGSLYKGWMQQGTAWYYFDPDDGSMYHSWNCEIGGKWYVFDTNGVWVSKPGWYQLAGSPGSEWYYIGSNGTGYTGWLKEGDFWYYIDGGYMVADYVYGIGDPFDNNAVFYAFDTNGHWITTPGWCDFTFNYGGEHDEHYKAYINQDGTVRAGDWLEENENKYYFSKYSGYMVADRTECIVSAKYDEEGQMVTPPEIYAFNENGEMISNDWFTHTYTYTDFDEETGEEIPVYVSEKYYLQQDGKAYVATTVEIEGQEYTFDEYGVCIEA